MPQIVIDQGVKCLNKDIFPHIKSVLDFLNPARSVCDNDSMVLSSFKPIRVCTDQL